MERSFSTHNVRAQRDMCGLWTFEARGEARAAYVPSCWETYPGFENYRGAGAYKKTFVTDARAHLRFVFGAVSHTARVLLDGREIGAHYGAYTAFDCLARDVRPGAHELVVRADNTFSSASALSVPNDYMTYGGITRACHMETVPEVFLRGLTLIPRKSGGAWTFTARATLVNLAEDERDFALEIAGAGETRALSGRAGAGESAWEAVLSPANVRVWSPKTPALYAFEARLYLNGALADDLIERTGFREFAWSADALFLNGEKIRILGLNRHEDMAGFGCAIPAQAMARDLMLLRDLGANAVRTSHYPNDSLFLDLCDETGFLVWEESHARGLSEEQMRNPNFMPQSEACLREMLCAHMSHPSIVFWGILNECDSVSDYGVGCYEKLFSILREADDTRAVVSASCRRGADWGILPPVAMGPVGDRCHPLEDMVCHNIYPGWFTDGVSTREYVNRLIDGVARAGGAGKPFIVSEVGAGAVYGWRDSSRAKWTEERQADILKEQLEALMSDARVAGVFVWQFCDCRVTDQGDIFRGRPRGMNNKGIVNEYRQPKLAYEVVKRAFHGEV